MSRVLSLAVPTNRWVWLTQEGVSQRWHTLSPAGTGPYANNHATCVALSRLPRGPPLRIPPYPLLLCPFHIQHAFSPPDWSTFSKNLTDSGLFFVVRGCMRTKLTTKGNAPVLVPVVRTSFSTTQFGDAMRACWPDASKEQAGIIWAQWALETGRGKACWVWNIGNVKATPSQVTAGVDYFMLPGTWEIIKGRREVFNPPHPQTWFRAFGSLSDGLGHHVAFLRDRRYKPAWPAVLSGNPDLFARELKRLGYYTASEDLYASAMSYFHAEWMRVVDYAGVIELDTVGTLPMGGIIHGTHIVDWALEQRELEREAELDAMLGGFGRYDEEAA